MTDLDDDHYDEYKDDLAMGRIWPDGSYREPDGEPPQEYLERTGPDPWEHRPSLRARITAQWRRLTAQPVTVRLGRLEFTIRWARTCGACAGRGWAYNIGTVDPVPPPVNCSGVSLCGCGSAITSLAASRRYVRDFDRRTRKEGLF